jgi:uncharacterized transporter YbjL
MNYDPNTMQVKVDVGVNFAMQKEIALQTVTALSQGNKQFADFFAEYGLQTILDNIDIRGIEGLKVNAEKWQAQQQQMRQQAQQIQQKQMQQAEMIQQMQIAKEQKELQAPAISELALMQLQTEAQSSAANIAIKQRDSDTKFLELISKVRNEKVDQELKASEIDARNARSQVGAFVSLSEHLHDVTKGNENEKEE